MRWFKHMTSSGDDEKLSCLMDSAGLEGYGFWWRVVEIVAGKVDEKGGTEVTFPVKKWGDLLGISAKKFEKLAEICASFEIFRVKKSEISENSITIDIPNILKFRDEWTERKSKTRESLPSNSRPSRARIPDPDPDPEAEDKNINTSSRHGSAEPDVMSEKPLLSKPKKKPEFAEDSQPYRLAVYMRDQLSTVLPTLKEPDLQKWAQDFDVALRNDERGQMRDAKFVAQVIQWVAKDSFWRTNCQCPATLRKQFDKLTARMAEEAAKARASPGQKTYFDAQMDAAMDGFDRLLAQDKERRKHGQPAL